MKEPKEKGLIIYCTKCHRQIKDNCKMNLEIKRIKCRYKDKHHYRSIVRVPLNNSIKKTMLHKSKDMDKVLREHRNFVNKVKSGEIQIQKIKQTIKPTSLYQCMQLFIQYKEGVGVPEHLHKPITEKQIKSYISGFRKFGKFLESQNQNWKTKNIYTINQDTVGQYHLFLKNDPSIAPITYNKYMMYMDYLFKYLIDYEKYQIANPFSKVKKITVQQKSIDTLSFKDLEKILEAITPEQSVRKVGQKTRSFYRPWLKNAILLSLYTGARRKEIFLLKWTDVYPTHIEYQNLKTNKNKVIVPMHNKLIKLLEQLPKNSEYLVSGEDKSSVNTKTIFLSKAFHHFAKLANVNASIKHLRKTYHTTMVELMGAEQFKIFDTHANTKVLIDHYLSKQKLVAKYQNIEIFD